MATIDMQTMRYINLLDSTSRVKTRKCFIYNNTIVFAVPRGFVSKAIGPDAINVRKIQEQMGKRVKIVEEANGIESAQKFVEDIVSPITFKSLELKDRQFVLTAGSQSKAALIGRNRRRLLELERILKDSFGFGVRIV